MGRALLCRFVLRGGVCKASAGRDAGTALCSPPAGGDVRRTASRPRINSLARRASIIPAEVMSLATIGDGLDRLTSAGMGYWPANLPIGDGVGAFHPIPFHNSCFGLRKPDAVWHEIVLGTNCSLSRHVVCEGQTIIVFEVRKTVRRTGLPTNVSEPPRPEDGGVFSL